MSPTAHSSGCSQASVSGRLHAFRSNSVGEDCSRSSREKEHASFHSRWSPDWEDHVCTANKSTLRTTVCCDTIGKTMCL